MLTGPVSGWRGLLIHHPVEPDSCRVVVPWAADPRGRCFDLCPLRCDGPDPGGPGCRRYAAVTRPSDRPYGSERVQTDEAAALEASAASPGAGRGAGAGGDRFWPVAAGLVTRGQADHARCPDPARRERRRDRDSRHRRRRRRPDALRRGPELPHRSDPVGAEGAVRLWRHARPTGQRDVHGRRSARALDRHVADLRAAGAVRRHHAVRLAPNG